jgi:hypothetical protein
MATVETHAAVKYDAGKSPVNLISRDFICGVADVLAFGAEKYTANNWRNGMEWSRCTAACMRHLTAWNEGEDLDPESGLSHLYHAACNLMFLAEYTERERGVDDRFIQGD